MTEPNAPLPSANTPSTPARTARAERGLREPPRRPGHTAADHARVAVQVLLAVFLFVLAIQMMKTGASSLAPRLKVTHWNALATLGLGALLAYVWLSGKPVAAFALGLFAAGGLTKLQAFTMLSGGRLGAAFIVLLVGFLYTIRGRGNRRESLGVGVLALSLTAVVYIPGMLLGYAILKTGALDGIDLTWSKLEGLVDLIWKPIVDVMAKAVPDALLLPLGGLVIVAAIKLLDRVLPEIDGARTLEGNGKRWRGTWPMFGLGFLVTLVTFSVSVALTILVPLAAKGWVTREEAIPYIMGSNVATLADTLLVAIVFGNAVGVQIVLAEAIGVAIVTGLFLALAYRPLCRAIMAVDEWVVGTDTHLWLFVSALFVLPAVLLAIGFALGPLTR